MAGDPWDFIIIGSEVWFDCYGRCLRWRDVTCIEVRNVAMVGRQWRVEIWAGKWGMEFGVADEEEGLALRNRLIEDAQEAFKYFDGRSDSGPI